MAEMNDLIEDSMKQVVSMVQGRPVTRGQLSKAFDLVKNDEHWKNPIDKTLLMMTCEEEAMIYEAVLFFAGCRPTFKFNEDGSVRVRAQGYYLSVGS
jgi:hypothetical protein